MDTGCGAYPQQVAQGRDAEARFDRIRGTHIISRANKYEDAVLGWDRKDNEWGTVGIKAMCGVHRGDAPQDDFFLVELLNRDKEQAGWAFKQYDYQAYEIAEGFLMVRRRELVPLACHLGLPLSRCGGVWIPRHQLAPYGQILLDNVREVC